MDVTDPGRTVHVEAESMQVHVGDMEGRPRLGAPVRAARRLAQAKPSTCHHHAGMIK